MHLRFCILVPTYNNPQTIASVVHSLQEEFHFPVIVVDDGSQTPVALERSSVTLLRHSKNLGKGVALQTGFKEALRQGFTHALVFDADGQHLASEVPKLIAEAQRFPEAMVIGAREMGGRDVPEVSRFGRRFSNFWVDRETGTKISDSQSGMRVYPLFHIQMMHFFTKRYDFEIEVLIRLMWKGVEVREVPVQVSYDPKGRVSHFKKFWDNARISVLNTGLFFVSMLKLHKNPAQVGLAVGFGVLIGTTPFFGFHTPIAFIFAALFRLNFAFLWLGTQISIPPLAPFLAAFSIEIDKLLFPKDSGNVFLEWLDGSLVLGALLGSIIGFFSGVGAWAYEKSSKQKLKWSGKSRGGKFGNGFLRFTIKHLGLKAGYFCLYFIVPYFYLFAWRATRASQEYWKVIEPEASVFERQWLVLKHYYTFGKVLLDKMYQGMFAKQIFQTHSNGAEHIMDACKNHRGLIMLSAHMGSWDIAAYHMQFKHIEDRFHTVEYGAQPDADKPGNFIQSIFHNRQTHAVLDIQGILSHGKPIGVMGDRPTTRRFELVPFRGKLIAVDITAFRMAATLGVELLFTFGFRDSDNKYNFFATAPKRYQFDSQKAQDEQTYAWACDFANTLDHFITRYKMQWFNFYPFFSSLPTTA